MNQIQKINRKINILNYDKVDSVYRQRCWSPIMASTTKRGTALPTD